MEIYEEQKYLLVSLNSQIRTTRLRTMQQHHHERDHLITLVGILSGETVSLLPLAFHRLRARQIHMVKGNRIRIPDEVCYCMAM